MVELSNINYIYCHNFSLFIHDILVNIIRNGESKNHFFVQVKLKQEKDAEIIKTKSGEDLFEWMETSGYEKEVGLLTYRHLFAATLSDFLHFIHTSLDCAFKYKMSVAYALLRKPFKDNLFILEWLLSDPNDFLNKFSEENSSELIAIDKIEPSRKQSIIKDCHSKIVLPLTTSDFLYGLRYDKKAYYGLEQSWQKANHIITTCHYYKTEKSNLNYVFSSSDDLESQVEYYYFIFPMLIYYAYQITISLYFGYIAPDEDIALVKINNVMIGYLIYAKTMLKNKNDVPSLNIQEEQILNCNICNQTFPLTLDREQNIKENNSYECPIGHKNELFKL